MKTRFLMIFLAIFAAVSCQKNSQENPLVGKTYQVEGDHLMSLEFISNNEVKVSRFCYEDETAEGFFNLHSREMWNYSLEGYIITFMPPRRLSLGFELYSPAEMLVSPTARLWRDYIEWECTHVVDGKVVRRHNAQLKLEK